MHNHYTITATEAMRTFSDILNKVHYQGKTFEIKRGKEIIATLSPSHPQKGIAIKELNDFFSNLPSLDEEDAEQFKKIITKIRKQAKVDKNPWD